MVVWNVEMKKKLPGLFGIKKSNRDFTLKESWGKNQFNSSFPASLGCYMHNKGFPAVYIRLNEKLKVEHSSLSISDLYKINPTSETLYFAFESIFTPYEQFIIGNIPGIDLVTQEVKTDVCLKGIEIKLTALPDNSTCDLPKDKYGCEIVTRPDTIIYLACSIAKLYKDNLSDLKNIIGERFDSIIDWADADTILPLLPNLVGVIDDIFLDKISHQESLVMQPIWKTIGKSPKLADNCLDIFVWSNFAFACLFLDSAKKELSGRKAKISRQVRSVIWLSKMLYDFSQGGQINYRRTIDELSYNTKNDKAFAVSGRVTHPYMECQFLAEPRIKRKEIKNIILGGGQKLLSPERRFDAIIYNSSDLFD